jgi:peptide/nickel transport system substrate-binding protein
MRATRPITYTLAAALAAAAVAGPGTAPAKAEEVLRFVPHADLRNLDPIWTTALITLNHGYMIYDTLFALDENLEPQPQMVDEWEVSDDGLTYTFTLRDGLTFHDGQPVTTADVIPSIERWAARDVMGQKIMEYTDTLEAVDDRTFRLVLNRPYGLVIDALAKPTAIAAFIMREEDARTDPYEQVAEAIGSGPFRFVQEEWVPGSRVVYVKNEDYVPRDEPPSGLAGGKIVKVDRVEWVIMPDSQTAMSALLAGEVDIYENPPLDFMAIFEGDPNVVTKVLDRLGTTGYARPNFLHPPFDDVRARRALLHSVDQEAYLRAAIGDERYFTLCKSYFVCGSPLETLAGAEPYMEQDLDKARELVEEAGLEGHRVVVLDPTDNPILHSITLVTVDSLRRIGFDVEVQAMDWATLTSRRPMQESPEEGGWNIFHTWSLGIELSSPAASFAINTSCDGTNWFGWPCDEELEELRVAWTLATDPEEQKRLAEELHAKIYEFVPYVPVGQWFAPVAYRSEVEGILEGPRFVLWNIEKRG